MQNGLRLEVRDFADLTRWRWTLTDAATGAFLADHEVRLDAGEWRFEAFTDLRGYISRNSVPGEPDDEARIVTTVGRWVTDYVLGSDIANAMVRRRPVTVQVVIPPGAEALAFVPLEIARVDGQPLSAHDVTLIVCPETGTIPRTPDPAAPVTDRLRVLGLFSLPEGERALSLRRERHALVRLFRSIAASGRAIEVRVLQYGVTRDRLLDILQEDPGWNIIHVSGHGTPGELTLETEAGEPDRVSADDLADLLDTARERTRLVTVSACSSAALTAAEQRRLLRLPDSGLEDGTPGPGRPGQASPDQPSSPGSLATRLADRLGCAVLAMRYRVGDEFAIALSGKLYDLLARQGQPLPRAVAMSLKTLRTGGPAYSELSMAAPALFGQAGTSLRLRAPNRPGPAVYDPAQLKLAALPPQAERFVGRTGTMASASAVLAVGSRVPGVVLHGLPGGGKTSCALELAYTHEDAFAGLVWYQAPGGGTEISGALTDFGLKLETAVDGLPLIGKFADERKLHAFLPVLTELMERTRLLIVIDGAESLLTDGGLWRDERWGKVFGALTGHTGFGRVILTSRRVPEETAGPRVEAVNALSLNESLLLLRELPRLRALSHAEMPGIDLDLSRKLALDALTISQGHPGLLGRADTLAADPGKLGALIKACNEAWQQRGVPLDDFISTGKSAATSDDYQHMVKVCGLQQSKLAGRGHLDRPVVLRVVGEDRVSIACRVPVPGFPFQVARQVHLRLAPQAAPPRPQCLEQRRGLERHRPLRRPVRGHGHAAAGPDARDRPGDGSVHVDLRLDAAVLGDDDGARGIPAEKRARAFATPLAPAPPATATDTPW